MSRLANVVDNVKLMMQDLTFLWHWHSSIFVRPALLVTDKSVSAQLCHGPIRSILQYHAVCTVKALWEQYKNN